MNEEADLLDDGAMRVDDAVVWSGIGRSMLYKLMACGEISSIKAGGRRLIPRRALRAYLETRLETQQDSALRGRVEAG